MSKKKLPYYYVDARLMCLKCGSFYCGRIRSTCRFGTAVVSLCSVCNCVSEAYIYEVLI